MIDENGYRANVGIVLVNPAGDVLWCRRIGARHAWQFPQGGINAGETAEQAMYRELQEELGLQASDVVCLAQTKDWVSYDLPAKFRRPHSEPLVVGQKQQWFLLRLVSDESAIILDACEHPEFDRWHWVDYWYPKDRVIEFKRDVYQQVLTEFGSQRGAMSD